MSAYMVSRDHLCTLANAATMSRPCFGTGIAYYHGESRREYDRGQEQKIVNMLHGENRRSILHRYPGDQEYAGPEKAPTFAHPGLSFTAVEILKLVDCYEYQACEHDDWSQSEAKAFCDALRKRMIQSLPGYDGAPWGI